MRKKERASVLDCYDHRVAQAYPRIEMGEERRSLREEMKEEMKEAIRKERAA